MKFQILGIIITTVYENNIGFCETCVNFNIVISAWDLMVVSRLEILHLCKWSGRELFFLKPDIMSCVQVTQVSVQLLAPT